MKKLFFTVLLSGLLYLSTNAQPTVSSSIAANSLVCIGSPVRYQVDFPTGLTGCSYVWRIKSGITSLEGRKDIQTFEVAWSDQKPNTVEVEVVVRYRSSSGSCTSPETATLTFTHTLRTVFQEEFFLTNPPNPIDYCSNGQVAISVSQMLIPNTGTGAIIPTEVNSYEWVLPSGWKQVGANPGTGTVNTNVNFILIEPLTRCTPGGNVIVRGVANNTSCIALPVSRSLPSTIALRRTPEFKILGPTNYSVALCGNRNPVSFSVPFLTCATGYTWNIPSGWAVSGSSTTNSITLIPSGSNGGTLTVTANQSGCSLQASFTIGYSDPPAPTPVFNSGPDLLCVNISSNYSVAAISGISNFQWYSQAIYPASTAGNVTLNGGTYDAPTNVLNAGTTVNVGAGAINGYGSRLFIRAANGACKASEWAQKDIWIGQPDPNNTARVFLTNQPGVNPVTLAPNTGYNFSMEFVRGASWYNWFPPTGFSMLYFSQSQLSAIRTSSVDGTYRLICQPENLCGPSSGSRFLRINITGSGGGGQQQRAVFPNPANSNLNIKLKEKDSEDETMLTLTNTQLEQVVNIKTKEKEIIIDVTKLNEGTYYLSIHQNGKTTQSQIVIKH